MEKEIKSLLAALFLQMIADENYRSNETFSARYDSDTIKEIAQKAGYTDLAEKLEELRCAYDGLDSACDEQEVTAYSEKIDQIEDEIEMEI